MVAVVKARGSHPEQNQEAQGEQGLGKKCLPLVTYIHQEGHTFSFSLSAGNQEFKYMSLWGMVSFRREGIIRRLSLVPPT